MLVVMRWLSKRRTAFLLPSNDNAAPLPHQVGTVGEQYAHGPVALGNELCVILRQSDEEIRSPKASNEETKFSLTTQGGLAIPVWVLLI